MLVKEYRICLPLTIDEYRIAQLYMIQKKSQQESTGEGSGVEIIKNEPYENGPGGNGQYTYKLYHIGSHLPAWFRNILPKAALTVEEEAWNAYPYTKTIYKFGLIEKFNIEIITCYHNDAGTQDNVFNLSEEEKKSRIIEYLDIVKDPISSGDYKVDEDPKLYRSKKTGRGPLQDNWREEYEQEISRGASSKRIMCAYKLCRIEFKYWGMQTKIEKFIDDIGFRKTMMRAHRQAWAWQDEWIGLTIDDIRNLEKQAQAVLAEKMRLASGLKDDGHFTKERTETRTDEVKEKYVSSSSQHNLEAIQRNDSVSSNEDIGEMLTDDESFADAQSHFPSETDSFMTCRNTFESNLALNFDMKSGTLERVNSAISSPPRKMALVLVVHGGSLLDTSHEYHNKHSDVGTLRQTMDSVVRSAYPQMKQRFASKLVACPPSVADLMSSLNRLSPQLCDQKYSSSLASQQYVPLAAIPLFLTHSKQYHQILETVRESINDRYAEFVRSEANSFDGHVSIIADSLGGIFVYDLLKYDPNASELSASQSDNSSGELPPQLLDFPVHDVFMLGSPLGLVLAHRQLSAALHPTDTSSIPPPVPLPMSCRNLFNIFHLTDPSSYRIEPLINTKFHRVTPRQIVHFSRYPHGANQPAPHSIGDSNYFIETLFSNPAIVDPDISSNISLTDFLKLPQVKSVISNWWGEKRLDYGLHCPDGVQSLPLGALPHLLHASYWESKDCCAFIIRQTIESAMKYHSGDDQSDFFDLDSIASTDCVSDNKAITDYKFSRNKARVSSFRFRNVSANHRANDVIVMQGQPQILTARFMYGTLDIVTPKNEQVNIYLMSHPHLSQGHWEKEGMELTDNNGRVQFQIAHSRRLPEGIYPIRMVMQSDSSAVDFHLAVVPPDVQVVVFSIDGSFAASVSLSGRDPKIRAGCVDVARFWAERGYLLLYVSARPSLQHRTVQRWLAQHKFPLGLLLFAEGVSREPQRQKMLVLSRLIRDVQMQIHCAYGSGKDVQVYQSLGLHSHQIFSLGKLSRAQKAASQSLKRGYAAHLHDLSSSSRDSSISKPSKSFANISFNRNCFELPVRFVNLNAEHYQTSTITNQSE